jgi:hypothetical protein
MLVPHDPLSVDEKHRAANTQEGRTHTVGLDDATRRSGSARSGNGRLRASIHRSWLSASWGEIPNTVASTPAKSSKWSRYEHIWRVHPGVKSPG